MPTTKIITEEGRVDYVLGTTGSVELDIMANRMETTPLDKVTYEVPNDLGKHVPLTYCAVHPANGQNIIRMTINSDNLISRFVFLSRPGRRFNIRHKR